MAEAHDDVDALRAKVAELEAQLGRAEQGGLQARMNDSPSSLHNLLLLADSALPLGSFAFSSGLESFLAHEKPPLSRSSAAFSHFLEMSLDSMAATTLPYVVAAFHHPETLDILDNDMDASITCSVVRRASIAQGRALLAVWERSFRSQVRDNVTLSSEQERARLAYVELEAFCKSLKLAALAKGPENPGLHDPFTVHGHLPPAFGILGAVLKLALDDLLYAYLLNHAKTLLSAGIRASVLGPYQAQGVLASKQLQDHIWSLVKRELSHPRQPFEAAQCAPLLDIWGGRHEIIYSRIFNS